MTEPRRGAKRRYLPDRPLTDRERYLIRKARKAGKVPPAIPQQIFTADEVSKMVSAAYHRGYKDGVAEGTD